MTKTKWQLREPGTIVVYHYYDEGYLLRPGNSIELLQAIGNNLTDYINTYVGIEIINKYISFESNADLCCKEVDGNISLSELNEHAEEYDANFLYENFENITTKHNQTTILVIWTGHMYYRKKVIQANGIETPVYASVSWGGVGIVMSPKHGEFAETVSNPYAEKLRVYTAVALHELSHQFGCIDHYCYNNYTSLCDNVNCLTCYLSKSDDAKKYEDCYICIMNRTYEMGIPNDKSAHCGICSQQMLSYVNIINEVSSISRRKIASKK